MSKWKHSEESKRKIGEASRERNSAAIALRAKNLKRRTMCSIEGCENPHQALGFCNMHYLRFRKTGSAGVASRLTNERGAGNINSFGYHTIRGHCSHIEVAEIVLGKKLPDGAVVHHVNGNKLDNSPSNLVICKDRAYHNLIHARTRAMEECGNPNWMKCPFCKKYDSPENMYIYPNKNAAKHRACYTAYRKTLPLRGVNE